jgi:ferrous iron transport protein B
MFNLLTGLNQKIGNFPGVTVEKKSGYTTLRDGEIAEIVDLPGIYSIYPRSLDEIIVAEVLLDHHAPTTPDKIVVIVDGTNLKRGLLLVTQVIDLGLPTVLALNMMDLTARAGISYDFTMLSKNLGIPVFPINARKGVGIDALKKVMATDLAPAEKPVLDLWPEAKEPVKQLRDQLGVDNDYEALQFLEQPGSLSFLTTDKRRQVDAVWAAFDFSPGKFQGAETIQRYRYLQDLLSEITLNTSTVDWK